MMPTGPKSDSLFLSPTALFLRKLRVIDRKRTLVRTDGNDCIDVVCDLAQDVPDVAPFISNAQPAATLLIRRSAEEHDTRVPCTMKKLECGARFMRVNLSAPAAYKADLGLDAAAGRALPMVISVIFDGNGVRTSVANPAFKPKASTNGKAAR